MRAHLTELKRTLKHKWFVFLEACKLGIPWLGLIHDISKFYPDEWFAYVNHFQGPNSHHKGGSPREATGDDEDIAFDYAWNHHQKNNKHHWQYWIMFENPPKALPIPDRYRREILADWRGYGREHSNLSNAERYLKFRDSIVMHPETREWIERQIFGV